MSVCRLRTDVTLTICHMVIPIYFYDERQNRVHQEQEQDGPDGVWELISRSGAAAGCGWYLLSSPQVAWGSLHRQYIMTRACRLLLFILWRSPSCLVLCFPNISRLVLLTVGFRRFPPPSGWGTKRYGCSAEFHLYPRDRHGGAVVQRSNVEDTSYGTSILKGVNTPKGVDWEKPPAIR
jgi:hypothetical protein